MLEEILKIIIGIVICVLGIINIKGNIALLHKYHIKRVSKENVKIFGKLVGIGTIIIGLTIIIAGIFLIITNTTNNLIYETSSNIILWIGFISGFCFIFYAMFKYNKGIF